MIGTLHIVVAMKPLSGSFVDNAKKHGVAGLNIDASRISHVTIDDGNLALNPHLRKNINGGNGGKIIAHEENRRIVIPNMAGRWPSNVILGHLPGCKCMGVKKVEEEKPRGLKDIESRSCKNQSVAGINRTGQADDDGKEMVENWECDEGCPIGLMDKQSGITKSGAMKHEVGAYDGNSITPFLRGRSGPSNQHGGTGGASRFFKQVREE